MVLFTELDVFVLRLIIIEEDLRDEFGYACVPDIFDTIFEKLRVVFDVFDCFGTEREYVDVNVFYVIDGVLKRLLNVVVVIVAYDGDVPDAECG
jgi:hypothetical protein